MQQVREGGYYEVTAVMEGYNRLHYRRLQQVIGYEGYNRLWEGTAGYRRLQRLQQVTGCRSQKVTTG